jgi:beta-lactamase superfamily II metal-dependent hydrolase
MTFRLTMFPALDGDCLLLSWGTSSRLHHILVDLGRASTYAAVKDELKALGEIELFVMSHVDADHIAGAIPMVREASATFKPKRVWYNSRPQLVAAQDRNSEWESLGARQGEKLARGIVKFGWPWNREFASEIVSTDSAESKEPIEIADGLTVRLLSPSDVGLASLLPRWDVELARAKIRTFDPDEEEPLSPAFEPLGAPDVAKLAGEDYQKDRTEANGSAIAFVAEFDGKRVLLAADAYSETLEAALSPLAEAEGGRYHVDVLKVSHHGSKANTSKALPLLIDCTRFAVSTDGSRHNHPDPQTIARFLETDRHRDKLLYFNYRQPHADNWDSVRLKSIYRYDCDFPVREQNDPGNGTLVIPV